MADYTPSKKPLRVPPQVRSPHGSRTSQLTVYRDTAFVVAAPAPTTGADSRRRQPAPTVISEPRRRLPHPTPSINVSTHRVPRLATRACEPDTPAHVPSAPGTPRSRRVHSTPTGAHAAFTFRAGAFLLRWSCLRLFRRTQPTPLSWRQHRRQHRRRHRRRPYIPVAPRLTTQHSHPLLRRFPWK